jgi:type II secretory pathway component PulC
MTFLKTLNDRLLSHPYTKPAALLVIALSGLWIVINFITDIVLIVHKPSLSTPPSASTTTATQTSNQLAQIPKWHLFGQTPPNITNTAQIPLSDLNLTLVGTLLKPKHSHSSALIKDASGNIKSYRIGDMITSGVTLFKIMPDSVVIKRNGELEKLTLPNRELKFSPPHTGIPRTTR